MLYLYSFMVKMSLVKSKTGFWSTLKKKFFVLGPKTIKTTWYTQNFTLSPNLASELS